MTEIVHVPTGPPLPEIIARPDSENPYHVYLESLPSESARRTMRGCLDHIAKILIGIEDGAQVPWGLMRYSHTMALRAQLMNKTTLGRDGSITPWSPSNINKHLTAIRRVLKEAWRLGQISAEDYKRATDFENLKGGRRAVAGRSIAVQEFAALLTVCRNAPHPIGVRDAAIVAVLQSTGLRREELASANRADYDPGERLIRVVGKGNKGRSVHVHEVAALYLGLWLNASEHIRGPLLCPIDRWANVTNRHMTADAIAKTVNRRRVEAGLPRLSPHDFRRTLAGDLLDEGVDLARVQQIMGHASPKTTSEYDRRPERERKAAIETLASRLPRPDELLTP
jgi:integrase